MNNQVTPLTALQKRIQVIVGEFGSGKTELAVNIAQHLSRSHQKTAIVDMDLMKPYFRTREHQQQLNAAGIEVLMPAQHLIHSDLPILPQQLTRYLYDETYTVVMDVGGGESSIVVAQIQEQLAENGYEAMMVINTKRPFTNSVEGICQTLSRIEDASKLTITALVSNTNLAAETTWKDILDGKAIVEEAAHRIGRPLQWVVAPQELQATEPDIIGYPVFYLERYTRYPWMQAEWS